MFKTSRTWMSENLHVIESISAVLVRWDWAHLSVGWVLPQLWLSLLLGGSCYWMSPAGLWSFWSTSVVWAGREGRVNITTPFTGGKTLKNITVTSILASFWSRLVSVFSISETEVNICPRASAVRRPRCSSWLTVSTTVDWRASTEALMVRTFRHSHHYSKPVLLLIFHLFVHNQTTNLSGDSCGEFLVVIFHSHLNHQTVVVVLISNRQVHRFHLSCVTAEQMVTFKKKNKIVLFCISFFNLKLINVSFTSCVFTAW